MRYMVIGTFKAGMKPLVYERLRETGRMLPSELTYIDSWVEQDGDRCFQLMETEENELFDAWPAQWDDLVVFEVVPVTSSTAKKSSS